MRPPFLSNTILHMRILGLLLLLAMGLAACRDKGPKTEVVYATDPNVMKVGSKDSAAVKTLVTMFMDRMKSGHPDSALMLLRTAKPDCEPQGLNREGFIEFMKTYRQFPVANYTLEYIKFKNPIRTLNMIFISSSQHFLYFWRWTESPRSQSIYWNLLLE